MELKSAIKLVDKNGNLFKLEIENDKERYFSISGQGQNSCGQVIDNIDPLNAEQSKLVELWEKYHLKKLPKSKEKELNELISVLKHQHDDRQSQSLSELYKNDNDLTKYLEGEGIKEVDKYGALIRLFDLAQEDLDQLEIDDYNATVQGVDYYFGTNDEMDEAWDNDLDNYIEECVLPEIPEHYQFYFDEEKFKNYCKLDGRGHSLNGYDGSEISVNFNDVEYYAYQQ